LMCWWGYNSVTGWGHSQGRGCSTRGGVTRPGCACASWRASLPWLVL